MKGKATEILGGLEPPKPFIKRIVSGGQTGADRAALDVAIKLAIPHGGWCPLGRRAEDGVIDSRYQLIETDTHDYAARTKRNVLDSDATLVLYSNTLEGGTMLTAKYAARIGKPSCRVRLAGRPSFLACSHWLIENKVEILNVAGPRASKDPVIYERTWRFLMQLLG
jgi:Circularly permutated YpsA SLOG family